MMTTFSNGILVLVEGNKKGREWFPALEWQAEEFVRVLRLDEMKSMGYPNPKEETEPFTHGEYQYQFVIIDDWGPCYLRNITTGKEREIKYLRLARSKNYCNDAFEDEYKNKPSRIVIKNKKNEKII